LLPKLPQSGFVRGVQRASVGGQALTPILQAAPDLFGASLLSGQHLDLLLYLRDRLTLGG
jgi:hypothetical protein